ncbi:hypothetical protein BKA63DRAFT_218156 [Paraphoma chrysanthemicola]|nr:hypothetical protein BKA63DRAFT_218156 [Paraphoma chrysanthemicola]
MGLVHIAEITGELHSESPQSHTNGRDAALSNQARPLFRRLGRGRVAGTRQVLRCGRATVGICARCKLPVRVLLQFVHQSHCFFAAQYPKAVVSSCVVPAVDQHLQLHNPAIPPGQQRPARLQQQQHHHHHHRTFPPRRLEESTPACVLCRCNKLRYVAVCLPPCSKPSTVSSADTARSIPPLADPDGRCPSLGPTLCSLPPPPPLRLRSVSRDCPIDTPANRPSQRAGQTSLGSQTTKHRGRPIDPSDWYVTYACCSPERGGAWVATVPLSPQQCLLTARALVRSLAWNICGPKLRRP